MSLQLRRLRSRVSQGQFCLYLGLALVNGALLPIQASMNAQVARSLTSVPLAAALSYGVGALALLAILVIPVMSPTPQWSGLRQVPRWSLLGGLLGTGYILSTIYFTSILGTTLTLGFVVGGQAIAGMVTDHFGWLGVPRQRVTPYRQGAIALLAIAIILLAQPR